MKFILMTLALTCTWTGISAPQAAGLPELNLTLNAPPCKTTKAKRPRLGAEKEIPYGSVIKNDLNGDGWCDFAIGAGFPYTGKTDSYFISEVLLLGSPSGWKTPLHGRKYTKIGEFNPLVFATFRVDMTDIRLIYPKAVGAPYVIGLYTGDSNVVLDKQYQASELICVNGRGVRFPQHVSNIYRWDASVGTFKRLVMSEKGNIEELILTPEALSVLQFYHTEIKRQCAKEITPL